MDSTGVTTPVLNTASEPAIVAGGDVARGAKRMLAARIVLAVVVLAICGAAVVYGLKARRDIWEWTANVHFQGDVGNGFRWGWNARRVKLFHVYDDIAHGQYLPSISPLDYTPLRLAAVTAWVTWAEHRFEGIKAWRDDYETTAPMLWGNTISELVSSLFVFLLIRMWIVRMNTPRDGERIRAESSRAFPVQVIWGICGIAISGLMYLSQKYEWSPGVFLTAAPLAIILLERGWALLTVGPLNFRGALARYSFGISLVLVGWYFLNWNGQTWLIPLFISAPLLGSAFFGIGPAIFGALLFWFNPAVLWDGHAWPQWDIWLMPWFLGAVLLACTDWWFAAGLCVAIGGSLKGQLFLGAPVLFLWPLFQWRINALFRLIVGVLFGTASIAFPWLLLSKAGFTWFVLMACAMGLIAPIALRWNIRRAWIIITIGIVAVMLVWPWTSSAPALTKIACPAIIGIVLLSRLLPPRLLPHVYALSITGAILVTIPVFNASSTWFTRGYIYGTERYAEKIAGDGTYNLPALLITYFHWPATNESPAFFPFIDKAFTFRQQMSIIYGLCAVLSGIGAAIHYRRRDTRFLVAIAAPWVIMYCLLPQMMGRYLVWGAAISSLLAGSGIGLALLGVLVSLISMNGMIQNQNNFYNVSSIIPAPLQRELFSLRPHLGWAVLLIAAIYLYYAFVPRTRATLM